MFSRKMLYLAVLLLTFGASSALADTTYSSYSGFQRGFEITPFGGSRFGGTIDTSESSSTVDYLTIKSTWNYGVMADVDLWQNLQFDFMWNRQPTTLGANEVSTGVTSNIGNATLDTYLFGLLYEFRQPEAKLKPFVVGGLGFTDFQTAQLLPFGNKLAYDLGGGLKYFFTNHIGARLEVRWIPSRTTSYNATFFDPFFGPYVATVNNHANQGSANLGLIIRF